MAENHAAHPKKAPVPLWLLENNSQGNTRPGGTNTGFLRKTLAEVSRVVQDDLLSERYARKNRLLQAIDPRVKLLSMLFFMLFAGMTQSFLTLVLLGAMGLLTALLSGLELFSFIKRVWLILPLIVLVLSVPAATSLFIPGKPLFYIYRETDFRLWFIRLPQELYLSAEGLGAVIRMSLRTGVSLSFGYVFVMTTRWNQVTKSLGVLFVPGLIVTILDMTYRYIFVLCRTAVEMFEARFLRTVGKIQNRESRRFVSNSIAFLFIKSSHLSEEIYHSMLCRGYTGKPVCLKEFKLSRSDFVWIFNMVFIAFILLLGEFQFG